MQLTRRQWFSVLPLSACAVSAAAFLKVSPQPAPVQEFHWVSFPDPAPAVHFDSEFQATLIYDHPRANGIITHIEAPESRS